MVDKWKHHSPLLRDAIITVIGQQPEEKIKSIRGRTEIQKLCEDRVKELLTKETGQPLVKKLLFTQSAQNRKHLSHYYSVFAKFKGTVRQKKELFIAKNRYIITLLKDMNYSRITF